MPVTTRQRRNPTTTPLAALNLEVGRLFGYTFDMGDQWEHLYRSRRFLPKYAVQGTIRASPRKLAKHRRSILITTQTPSAAPGAAHG